MGKKKWIKSLAGRGIITLAALAMFSFPVLGDEIKWDGGLEGLWNVPTNWDLNRVPVTNDDVIIELPGVSIEYANTANNSILKTLRLGLDPLSTENLPGEFSITQDQDILKVINAQIGSKGFANYYHNGGTFKILQNLTLGNAEDGEANYYMKGGTLQVDGHEYWGLFGFGWLAQDGPTLQSQDEPPTLQCTPSPTPTPPAGPTHSVGKNLYLGFKPTGYGLITLANTGLTVNGSARVAIEGEGWFGQANSQVKIKGQDPEPLSVEDSLSTVADIYGRSKRNIGSNELECVSSRNPGLIVGLSNSGYYLLDKGSLEVNFSEIIGLDKGGNGVFDQSDGIHTVKGNLYLGKNDGSDGTFRLSVTDTENGDDSAGLLKVNGFGSIGHSGKGYFEQYGGKAKFSGYDPSLSYHPMRSEFRTARSKAPTNGNLSCHTPTQHVGLIIGREGLGDYYLNNGELLVSRGEIIGVTDSGKGYFNQDGGSHYVGGALIIDQTIASEPENQSQYDLFNGLLVVRGGLTNNGKFYQEDGLLQAQLTNNREFNFHGGTIQGKVINKAQSNFNVEEAGEQKVLGDFYNQEGATLTAGATGAATAEFTKNFSNNGALKIMGGSSVTIKHLTVGSSGYLVKPGEVGTVTIIGDSVSDPTTADTLIITGNFYNKSTKAAEWNTDMVNLVFSGPVSHYFKTGSSSSGDWANNFGWGSLNIAAGAKVRLQGHLYAKTIEGITYSGDRITNLFGYSGIQIVYDTADSANSYLFNPEKKKLYTPWGKLVGCFTSTGFLPPSDCN